MSKQTLIMSAEEVAALKEVVDAQITNIRDVCEDLKDNPDEQEGVEAALKMADVLESMIDRLDERVDLTDEEISAIRAAIDDEAEVLEQMESTSEDDMDEVERCHKMATIIRGIFARL